MDATYLLTKGDRNLRYFSSLHPYRISSLRDFPDPIGKGTWISWDKRLTTQLIKRVSSERNALGRILVLHEPTVDILPALLGLFQRVVFAKEGGFLPAEELAEVLSSREKRDLFIGGTLDRESETLTLFRGNLDSLTVPFSTFPRSGDGLTADFSAFSIEDCGQTVRLGVYEAATDAILYESDPDYRRRKKRQLRRQDSSLGGCLRRLRKQRGLARSDFSPLNPKTIARIEEGKIRRPHESTLSILAQRLSVSPDEIETY